MSAPSLCPISTRPAYYGTRRIAPAAATSRIEAWGARPAVEELRPARPNSETVPSKEIRTLVRPTASFIAHVIGQMIFDDRVDPRHAARSYAAADALNYQDLSIPVATI